MKCPFCNHKDSKVIDSRPTDEGNSIRRRRECTDCKRRFTTFEVVESLPIVVIKKDSSREAFDRDKLMRGLLRACEKRPVSLQSLNELVSDIELSLHNSMEREVRSDKIGEMVMERLAVLDEISYVRFASVYRQFKDINTFMKELNEIIKKNNA